MPKVSVIVPVGDKNQIVRAMPHLVSQGYPDYEIILVDNTGNLIIPSCCMRPTKGIDVRIIKELKEGSYAARNAGIRLARGSILAFIDSDCIADKGWLGSIVKTFDNPKIALVGGRITSKVRGNPVQRYLSVFGHPQHLFGSAKQKVFATSNMAVRKSCFRRYGLFDESLLSGGDFEFCMRVPEEMKLYSEEAHCRHIYPEGLADFIRRYYRYGKWAGYRTDPGIALPGYFSLLRDRPGFLPLRLLHDISYHIGRLL